MPLLNLGSAGAVMKKRLITAMTYETVATAADRMAENSLGALLVIENDRLVGIFSERDILHRVIARQCDPQTTALSKVLTPNPTTVYLDTPLSDCIEIIRTRGFRHLPVINEFRNPIGIISSRDLLQHVLDTIAQLHQSNGDLAQIFGPQGN